MSRAPLSGVVVAVHANKKRRCCQLVGLGFYGSGGSRILDAWWKINKHTPLDSSFRVLVLVLVLVVAACWRVVADLKIIIISKKEGDIPGARNATRFEPVPATVLILAGWQPVFHSRRCRFVHVVKKNIPGARNAMRFGPLFTLTWYWRGGSRFP